MAQDTVVDDQIEAGDRLTRALADDGFTVRIAFWAKPVEDGRWYIYLASPAVDEQGPAVAYRSVHDTLRRDKSIQLDPFDVKVVGMDDSMTVAALAVVAPRIADSPFAVRNPKPYPGITHFGGDVLGGVVVEGVTIYPPFELSPRS